MYFFSEFIFRFIFLILWLPIISSVFTKLIIHWLFLQPLPETVALVEDIVVESITDFVSIVDKLQIYCSLNSWKSDNSNNNCNTKKGRIAHITCLWNHAYLQCSNKYKNNNTWKKITCALHLKVDISCRHAKI